MYKRILLSVLATALLLLQTTPAYAANCTSTATYGSVTANVNIPTSGEYILWARLQPTSLATNALDIEVSNNTCFTISGSNLSTSAMSWRNYSGSSTSNVMKYTFSQSGNFPIKLIGLQEDVKIDKIIFIGTSESCSSNGSTPSGDGTNCSTGVVVGPSGSGGGTTAPSVTTPAVVTAQPENVQTVEYFVDGNLVQAVNGAEGFDTSLVENGEYELLTKVTLKDGNTLEQKDALIVNNPPQRFGGFRRWVRQQGSIVKIGAVTLSTALTAALTVFGLKALHHRKMFLMHHGLQL